MLAKPKPSIARVNRGRGHSYTIDGKWAPGATTLLGAVLAKPALVGWAARLVAEYVADKDRVWLEDLRADGREALVDHLKGVPDRARNAAAERGTLIHSYAERVIAGEELEDTPELEPLWDHVQQAVYFLDEWGIEPLCVEAVLANRTHRYCGTADLVAVNKWGAHAVYDYKTGDSGIWPETALQLAAYLHAEAYLDEDGAEADFAGLGAERAYAVHLRNDGYAVHPVETDQSWEAFKHLAAAFHLGVGARDGGWKTWIREAVVLP
jgi:hypothetical protein